MTSPTRAARVRLCKGAYEEPESVAYQAAGDVDKSYVRCLKVLMAGRGLPDGRQPRPAADRDRRGARGDSTAATPKSFEYQMLYGIRPEEQRRIADRGDQMRVYVPYGEEWYGYLMRRMAEKPATSCSSSAALASKG